MDLWAGGAQHQLRRPLVRRWARAGGAAARAGTVHTPMPGRIVKASGGLARGRVGCVQ